jgi:hypothetical protein
LDGQSFSSSRRLTSDRPIDPRRIRAGATSAYPAVEAIQELAHRQTILGRSQIDLVILDCLVGMALRRGIEVYFDYRPDLQLQGAIYSGSNGTYLMWVNSKDPVAELCDTVAHELGHWRMHRKGAPTAAFWQKVGRRAGLCRYDAREHQADRFAKLLVALLRRRLGLPR